MHDLVLSIGANRRTGEPAKQFPYINSVTKPDIPPLPYACFTPYLLRQNDGKRNAAGDAAKSCWAMPASKQRRADRFM